MYYIMFTYIYQANSLLGQNVEVNVDGKKSSGKVEYVDFSDSKGASVSIGGTMYPLDSITKVYPEDTKVQEENTNFFTAAANSIKTIPKSDSLKSVHLSVIVFTNSIKCSLIFTISLRT